MPRIELAVFGAHLSGMTLNGELTALGATLAETARTAPHYRFFALETSPPKPGLLRVAENGAAIECEVWALDAAGFGAFVAGIPHPLGIGKIELAGSRWVPGFICEPAALATARDITQFGGWRGYIENL
jgi:allophanate hydrolase